MFHCCGPPQKTTISGWRKCVKRFPAVAGVELGGVDALAVGWQLLRDTIRSMGIQSRERRVDPQSRVPDAEVGGGHFSSRVQERILDLAIARDARVSAFECIFMKMTLAQCEQRQGRRADAACRKVQMGEVSRARQCLTGAALAPGSEATFTEMQSRRPQEVQCRIPREILDFVPESPIVVDRKIFLKSLKSAPRGASPGPGACVAGQFRHIRSALGGSDESRPGDHPEDIAPALVGARLTALSKPDGGV